MRDFSHLLGRMRGITDRAMSAHLDLYRRAVARLEAIEAAYPVVESHVSGGDGPRDATLEAVLRTPVARLDLRPLGALSLAIATVEKDFADRNIRFRPRWYLGGDDFWTTDRGISVNIPWYYANPTLWSLANRSDDTCYTPEQVTRTLRHEAGHALCYAFELWRQQGWKDVFGDSRAPYNDAYVSDGKSRDFVEYISGVTAHYGQKHPDEDFAEVFACWLDPTSNWRVQYADWPGARRKLEYMDELWKTGLLSGDPPNTYPGQPDPYRAVVKGTVAEALEVGTAKPVSLMPNGWSDQAAVLRALPDAHNHVLLHERHFENLGASPAGQRFIDAAAGRWGSWDNYLMDLRLAASTSNGWVLTLWDRRRKRLCNVAIEGDGSVPAETDVLLALDLHEHAYALDYGAAKHLGMAAQMENLSWATVTARFEAACPRPISIELVITPDNDPDKIVMAALVTSPLP